MINKVKLFTAIIAGFAMLFSGCNMQQEEEIVSKKMEKKKERVKVAVLVTEGFHDAEAYMPIGYLYNRGAKITVIGPEKGKVKAYNSDFTIKIQKAISEVSADDFDALILPGGKAPATLRENEEVVAFAKAFFESGKTTAAICHGPQVLVTADVLDGIKSTSFPGIKEEMEEAGVIFEDTALVVDGNLITSRVPSDLSQFCEAIEKALFKK